MGLSVWTVLGCVALAAGAPLETEKRYKQSPLSAHADGQTVEVNGTAYYVPAKPEITLSLLNGPLAATDAPALFPITVLVEGASDITTFSTQDDVWSPSFGTTVLLPASLSAAGLPEGVTTIFSESCSDLPAGPYFLSVSGNSYGVYKAYRLYTDSSFAFYYGLVDDQEGGYKIMAGTSPATDGAASIAVPSRLYYAAPTAEKPLSGVRLGVKDLYHIKGLKTSMGNRAWFHLYPPANDTAVSVQRLIDLGAIVVGKTRTSQFANGEAPTIDWVDYHDPFNPRGDGYGDPSSSSAGAGSAEASYDWIDMNIGSDTGGSVRAPAGYSSLYGNRPSLGAISTTGVLPMSPEMDTLAFVTRSAAEFSTWGKAWYGENPVFKSYTSFPTKLIYPIDTPGINTTEYPSPGFFPSSLNDSQPLYDAFIAALESILNTTKLEYDFYSEYKDTSGTGLYPPDHVGEVWTKLTCYEQSRNVWNPFFGDYEAAHDGDAPFLDPPVKRNYEYGLNQTDADYERILEEKGVFESWVRTQLLTSDFDSASCSNAILVNPIVTGAPTSKATYAEAPTGDNVYLGWNRYGISQLAGVPEVVLPLGTVPYLSPVTGTIKQSPVAVSLLAGFGCDFMLFDLVEKLAEVGAIPSVVRTGSVL
ncbi:amidase signature domain-containing protein [Lophiotrema nucula]|uniref:Amidase signature domain-containing protein n=1 Tax=Lophiotrema nucula TaxID=690887 RepID=A0A6A5YVI2_9PLEO|nr:amidase signature domain-containing protein [Lophiotrema nucula]